MALYLGLCAALVLCIMVIGLAVYAVFAAGLWIQRLQATIDRLSRERNELLAESMEQANLLRGVNHAAK